MALTVVDQGLLGTNAQYTGFKNRIINGAMVIDQRNAGASVTPASNGTYTLDRWNLTFSQGSKFTAQQTPSATETGYATRVAAGFTNYLALTVASAVSVGASDYFAVQQQIEGFNVADLGWGTSSAKTVTLSFLVYSSLTGTFGGALGNSAGTRSYPFTYTISSANTWTQISVTISGDTAGTWLTTNGTGMYVRFGLGAGSTYSGTAGSWAGATYISATGAVSVVGTGSATFYITGVQLEKGSTATSFDYRPYGTELQLCQRYYQKSYNTDVSPTTSTPVGCLGALAYGSGSLGLSIQFCATMRVTPTITVYSQTGSSGVVSQPGGTNVGSGFSVDQPSVRGSLAILSGSGMTTNSFYYCHYVANAEL